jgi:hypothetical protein
MSEEFCLSKLETNNKNNQSSLNRQSIKMDKFVDKKYKLVRSENLEELLTELGVLHVKQLAICR